MKFDFLAVSLMCLLTALALGNGRAQAVFYPINNGFELPDLGGDPATSFKYFNELAPDQLAAAAWTFTGSSGIAANGSFFNVKGASMQNNGGAHSTAGQCAFITADGTLSQSVMNLPAGSITISLAIEGRTTDSKPNPIEVSVDGRSLGVFTPNVGETFKVITTPATQVTGGAHLITISGTLKPGTEKVDPTTFIDDVLINTGVSTSFFELPPHSRGIVLLREKA